jgi:hypothetical protein
MVTVSGLQGEVGEAAEVGIDVGRGDARDIPGEAFFLRYLGEASEGPSVGPEGRGGLPLDLAAEEVEVDELLQIPSVVAVAVASSQHRSIADILARVACVVYVYITLVGEEVKPNRGR